MTSAERTYPFQEQELLALIYALKKWIHISFGMEIPAYSDHSSLDTWETNRKHSATKARLIQLLCEFPVKILYGKGQRNIVADALSKREDYRPINSLSILEDKEMTDTICDIAAYLEKRD
jgi:hypothetical protein